MSFETFIHELQFLRSEIKKMALDFTKLKDAETRLINAADGLEAALAKQTALNAELQARVDAAQSSPDDQATVDQLAAGAAAAADKAAAAVPPTPAS